MDGGVKKLRWAQMKLRGYEPTRPTTTNGTVVIQIYLKASAYWKTHDCEHSVRQEGGALGPTATLSACVPAAIMLTVTPGADLTIVALEAAMPPTT